MARKSKSAVYQLKVTLKGSKPPIWRRVVLPGNVRLDELHNVIQVAMGWTNSHLHQFTVKTTPQKPKAADLQALMSGSPWEVDFDRMSGVVRYSSPEFELDDAKDETTALLNEIAPREKTKFIYEYDFGDGWEHDVLVEKIRDGEPGEEFPRCTAGKLACPPEDCGGIWGYAELIEALSDKKHERHEELSEWLGDEFDSEYLDLDEINSVFRTWKMQ